MEFTRKLFLRNLAGIYSVAFTSFFIQYKGLYSNHGLNPINSFLEVNANKDPSFFKLPTIGIYKNEIGLLKMDTLYMLSAFVGIIVSLLAFVEYQNNVCFFVLWIIYLSLFTVGQTFLSFQWDILLLEVGFLSIFFSPFIFENQYEKSFSETSLWMIRFVFFKLMLMSGVVKIQSECPTWLSLTALHYHYATQPLTTLVAYYANFFPDIFNKIGVANTFYTEIPATFMIIMPFRWIRYVGGLLQICLQFGILITGNYTFFNWLTITLAILCFDDVFFHYFILRRDHKIIENESLRKESNIHQILRYLSYFITFAFILFQFVILDRMFLLGSSDCDLENLKELKASNFLKCFKSIDISLKLTPKILQLYVEKSLPSIFIGFFILLVIMFLKDVYNVSLKNKGLGRIFRLFSTILIAFICFMIFILNSVPFSSLDRNLSQQIDSRIINIYRSASPFHLTSGYGLFRRMTGVGKSIKHKNNTLTLVVERPEIVIEGSYDQIEWLEYNFKYKPGNTSNAPRFVAPHQPRLDWQLWFAALSNYNQSPYFIHLIHHLFKGTPEVISLLDKDNLPFPIEKPPNFIRANLYHYSFTKDLKGKDWWQRKYKGEYIPMLEKDNQSLQQFLKNFNWGIIEKEKKVNYIDSKFNDLFDYLLDLPLLIALYTFLILQFLYSFFSLKYL